MLYISIRSRNWIAMRVIAWVSQPHGKGGYVFFAQLVFKFMCPAMPFGFGVTRFFGQVAFVKTMSPDDPQGIIPAVGGQLQVIAMQFKQFPCLPVGNDLGGFPSSPPPGTRQAGRRGFAAVQFPLADMF